jgi:hypothetical protein
MCKYYIYIYIYIWKLFLTVLFGIKKKRGQTMDIESQF